MQGGRGQGSSEPHGGVRRQGAGLQGVARPAAARGRRRRRRSTLVRRGGKLE